MTHTPGPWRVERGAIVNEAGDVLASVPYTLGDDSDRANARIMAAAPELLAACEDVLAGRVDLDQVRAAVAKTKG